MRPDPKFAIAGSKIRKTTLTLEARVAEPDIDDDDIEFRELDDDFDLGPAPASTDVRPNPVELPAPINPEGGRKQSVEMHRNLFCLQYDACLDEER